MESETGLIFQASTPKSKMKPYVILKSTGAIVIQNIFPRRATLIFRRVSHYIRYNGPPPAAMEHGKAPVRPQALLKKDSESDKKTVL